jgi:hypothetical protein
MTKPTLKGSLNIPGTFEVHDREGHVYGTHNGSYFKNAEAQVEYLNRTDPDGEYTWTRIPHPPAPPARPVIEHALTAYGYSPSTVAVLLDRLIAEESSK